MGNSFVFSLRFFLAFFILTCRYQKPKGTEVCGKVLSEKASKTSSLLTQTTKTAVCLQTKAIRHHLYGF